MIRPLLSLKRLSFDETEGKVSYQYGKDSSELERMDYVEFIARVTSHIPVKARLWSVTTGFIPTLTGEKYTRQEPMPFMPSALLHPKLFNRNC